MIDFERGGSSSLHPLSTKEAKEQQTPRSIIFGLLRYDQQTFYLNSSIINHSSLQTPQHQTTWFIGILSILGCAAMAEIAGLVFGPSAICSIFKKCFQGYEFLHKVKALPADAEYLLSRLIIEEHRLLLFGRALGLVKDEATVQRDREAGGHNDECEEDWLQSPKMRRMVEEIFIAIELQGQKISRLKEKYSLSEVSSDSSNIWQPIPFVRRSFSELTNNPSFTDSAIQRRASSELWRKNVPLAKKTLWAAVDKELLTRCISEFHILNNTLDSATTPFQHASLAQALSSQIQRSLSLLEIAKEVPTLGVFERAAAESDNRYLDLSIEVQRQLCASESESPRATLEGAFTNKAQVPSERIEFDASDLPNSTGARDDHLQPFMVKALMILARHVECWWNGSLMIQDWQRRKWIC